MHWNCCLCVRGLFPCCTFLATLISCTERIYICVIDPFTIKPLDTKTIMDHARSTKGRILTVEDHYYEGGLGEAVSSAVVNESGFTLQRLAVPHLPHSGKMSQLLKIYDIERESIVQAVRKMISSSANAK